VIINLTRSKCIVGLVRRIASATLMISGLWRQLPDCLDPKGRRVIRARKELPDRKGHRVPKVILVQLDRKELPDRKGHRVPKVILVQRARKELPDRKGHRVPKVILVQLDRKELPERRGHLLTLAHFALASSNPGRPFLPAVRRRLPSRT